MTPDLGATEDAHATILRWKQGCSTFCRNKRLNTQGPEKGCYQAVARRASSIAIPVIPMGKSDSPQKRVSMSDACAQLEPMITYSYGFEET